MRFRNIFIIFLLFLNCFFYDFAHASFLQKYIYQEMQNPRNYVILALVGFVWYQQKTLVKKSLVEDVEEEKRSLRLENDMNNQKSTEEKTKFIVELNSEKDKVKDLEKEIELLQNAVKKHKLSKESIEKLEKTLEDQEKEINFYIELKKKYESESSLKEQNMTLSNDLLTLRNENDRLKASIISLNGEIERLNITKKNIELISSADTLNKEVEKAVQIWKDEYNKVTSSCTKLREDIEALNKKNSQLEFDNRELQSKTNNAQEVNVGSFNNVDEKAQELMVSLENRYFGILNILQKFVEVISKMSPKSFENFEDEDLQKYHEYKKIIKAFSGGDQTHFDQFLGITENFLNIFFKYAAVQDQKKQINKLTSELNKKNIEFNEEIEKLKDSNKSLSKSNKEEIKNREEKYKLFLNSMISMINILPIALEERENQTENSDFSELVKCLKEKIKLLIERFKNMQLDLEKTENSNKEFYEENQKLQLQNNEFQNRICGYQGKIELPKKKKFTSNVDSLNLTISGIQCVKNEQAEIFKNFIKKLKFEHKNQIKVIKNQYENEKDDFKKKVDIILLEKENEYSKRVDDLENYKNGLELKFKDFEKDLQVDYQMKKQELSAQYDLAVDEVKNSLEDYNSFFDKIDQNKKIMKNPYIGLF